MKACLSKYTCVALLVLMGGATRNASATEAKVPIPTESKSLTMPMPNETGAMHDGMFHDGAMLTGVVFYEGKDTRSRGLSILKTYPVADLPKEKISESAKIAPGDVVGNSATLAKLFKSWGLDSAKQPKVDFTKHILYVVTQDTGDPNTDMHIFKVGADGNLISDYVSTLIKIDRLTGIHRVKLMLLDREGIRGVKVWVKTKKGLTEKVVPIPTES